MIKKSLKLAVFTTMLSLTGSILFTSCSEDDTTTEIPSDQDQSILVGKYNLEITPMMMGTTAITTGNVEGTVTNEGNGIFRLNFNDFNASPMPFKMSVDAQFTVKETAEGFVINNVDGKGNFKAEPVEGANQGGNPWNLPEEILKQGVQSNGASKISGSISKNAQEVQYNLQLDPAVGLPVTIKIKSLNKIS